MGKRHETELQKEKIIHACCAILVLKGSRGKDFDSRETKNVSFTLIFSPPPFLAGCREDQFKEILQATPGLKTKATITF